MPQRDMSASNLTLYQELWVCKIHKSDFRIILSVGNKIFWSMSFTFVQLSEYSSIHLCGLCFFPKVNVLIT